MLHEIDRDYKLESDRAELKKQVMMLEDKALEEGRTREDLKVMISQSSYVIIKGNDQ